MTTKERMSGEPMDPGRLARLRNLIDDGALGAGPVLGELVRELLADRDRLARISREAQREVAALLGPEPDASEVRPSAEWLAYLRRRCHARRPLAAGLVLHLLDEIDRLRAEVKP